MFGVATMIPKGTTRIFHQSTNHILYLILVWCGVLIRFYQRHSHSNGFTQEKGKDAANRPAYVPDRRSVKPGQS